MTGWRFHLQTLPGRVWKDRDMPLQGATVVEAVNGAAAITGGTLRANYEYAGYLKAWGALIVAEKPGAAPVAAIIDKVTPDGAVLQVEAGGLSMYPAGMPWTGRDYAGVQQDPLDLVRMIWAELQAAPGGDLGLVLDGTKSAARVGKPEDPKLTAAKAAVAAAASAEASAKAAYNTAAANRQSAKASLLAAVGLPSSGLVFYQDNAPGGTARSPKNLWVDRNDGNKAYIWTGKAWALQTIAAQATINSRLADYNNATTTAQKTAWDARKKDLDAAKTRQSDIKDGEAEPFVLTWWETKDLGAVIADLAKLTPFEYREASAWDGDEITHRLELGAPALGSRREDLRFEIGVNVTLAPTLDETDYASEVLLLGAGEGRSMVRAAATGNPGRLRRVVVVERKDLGKPDQAAAAARAEVAARAAEWTFDTLQVFDHEFAPYGSFRPGDVILVTGRTAYRELNDWVRILELSTDTVTGAIELKVEPA